MDKIFWNLLHDADINEVKANSTGDIVLRLGISYLMPHLGKSETEYLYVKLKNCTRFEFQVEYEGSYVDPTSWINQDGLQLLSAATVNDEIKICCVEGFLYLNYDEYTIHFSDGHSLEIPQLVTASNGYWNKNKDKTALNAITRKAVTRREKAWVLRIIGLLLIAFTIFSFFMLRYGYFNHGSCYLPVLFVAGIALIIAAQFKSSQDYVHRFLDGTRQ